MKKILGILIILLLFPLFDYPQFHVLEKAELYVTYAEGARSKVKKFFLTDSERGLFYRGTLSPNSNICFIYDVDPGKYMLGLDIGEELVLAQHVYSIKLDPATSEIYSDLYYENVVEVHENRNLKIFLTVANENGSGVGIIKRREFKAVDYDMVYFDYFIPAVNTDPGTTAPSQVKTGLVQKERMASGDCTSKFRYDTREKQFYEDYSGLFNNAGCSYCYETGQKSYTLTLDEEDIKYKTPCDRLKIKKASINFIKYPDVENLNLNPTEFGRQVTGVTVNKNISKVVTRDCAKEGEKCTCKFDVTFYLNIFHQVSIRDELSTQNMLCDFFSIPCIVNNEAVKNKNYPRMPDAGLFRKATLDHEKLHCVQFRLLAEGLFKGQLENSQPFYFGNKKESDFLLWEGKTLADKICDSVGDIPCCKTGECDKTKCIEKEKEIQIKAVTMMEDLIKNRFKTFMDNDLLELPCWHFTFIQFNKYKWGGQSCNEN